MPSTEWVHGLKVVELKEECRKRGLAVSGKKAELAERLEAWIQENEKSPGGEAPAGTEPAAEPAVEEEQQQQEEEQPAAAAEQKEVAAEEAAPASAPQGEEEPAAAEPATMEAEGASAVEPPAAKAEGSPAAAAELEAEQQPAAMEEDQEDKPSAAAAAVAEEEAQPEAQPAKEQPAEKEAAAPAVPAGIAGADVDLDYGEESEGDGAAAVAEEEQQQRQAKPEAEGQKRKRQEEGKEQAPAAAPTAAAPAPRRPSVGSRLSGPGAEKALAAAVSQSQASAERPSKVPRTSSGYSLGGAEKGEAPAPEDVPEAAEPATRALRIDGFVRPFTERQVRDLLSETGQVVAMWMPSIKTHAYAVMESKEQAEATRRATYQLQWPSTNPKRLAPKFVPLAEAEAAIGNGAGNPDFRLKRVEEDGPEATVAPPAAAAVPAPTAAAAAAPAATSKEAQATAAAKEEKAAADRSQREWNRNRRSPSPPLEGVRDLREMLSRKPSSSARSGEAPPAAVVAPRSERDAGPVLPPGLGRPAPDRRDGGRPVDRRREEAPVLTLDELFKKTAAKPCIYWLPLTDEEVAEKKRKAAEAAEAAAAVAAAGSGGDSDKAAQNGGIPAAS